jgi:DNA-binding XRE family transcriptional regulator
MLQHGTRQSEAARLLKVSSVTLSRWECDKVYPTWAQQPSIVTYFLPVALSPATKPSTLPIYSASRPLLTSAQQTSVAKTLPEKSDPKMLSDEELFALFPGRSLALVGKPGYQQLVFLDTSVRR